MAYIVVIHELVKQRQVEPARECVYALVAVGGAHRSSHIRGLRKSPAAEDPQPTTQTPAHHITILSVAQCAFSVVCEVSLPKGPRNPNHGPEEALAATVLPTEEK